MVLYNLIFSERALINIENIDKYLLSIWGINAAKKFHKKMDDFATSVINKPTIGIVCSRKRGREIRQFPITKQNLVIYRIDKTNIRVLKVFDVRQHPNKKLQGIK